MEQLTTYKNFNVYYYHTVSKANNNEVICITTLPVLLNFLSTSQDINQCTLCIKIVFSNYGYFLIV